MNRPCEVCGNRPGYKEVVVEKPSGGTFSLFCCAFCILWIADVPRD